MHSNICGLFFSFLSLYVTFDDNFPDRYNFVQSFKLPSINVVPDANILKPPPWDSEKRQECPPRADWQSCCLGLWVGACVCAGDGDWGRTGCSAVAWNRERLTILSMTRSWRNWLTTIQHMHVWSTFCMDMSSQRWSTYPNIVLTFAQDWETKWELCFADTLSWGGSGIFWRHLQLQRKIVFHSKENLSGVDGVCLF